MQVSKSLPMFLIFTLLTVLATLSSTLSKAQSDRNLELFTTLYDRVLQREAFSPIKDALWQETFEERVASFNIRGRFEAASTPAELFNALNLLSCARRDTHLSVSDDGIDIDEDDYTNVPLRFLPDLSAHNLEQYPLNVAFFVSQKGRDSTVESVSVGDELVAVNGIQLVDYLALLVPEYRASTLAHSLIRRTAAGLSQKFVYLSSYLYAPDNRVTYLLRRRDGTTYNLVLTYDYTDFDDVDWDGFNPLFEREYTGFTRVLESEDFQLYVPDDSDQTTLILRWFDFEDVADNLTLLESYLSEYNLWSHNLVLDASVASGGSGSPFLIQRLAKTPFKTTFGNVRCSDITRVFSAGRSRRVRDWIDTDCDRGLAYTTDQPFKLRYFVRDSDGIMSPDQNHFTGNVAGIFGPYSGSNYDQMVAMFIDNDIGMSFGLPSGGYSNTWEWGEAIDGVEFLYSIGHTIRPNGEILEGNPAQPRIRHPIRIDNFQSYYQDMVAMAIYEVENREEAETPSGRILLTNRMSTGFLQGSESGVVSVSPNRTNQSVWESIPATDGGYYLRSEDTGQYLTMAVNGSLSLSDLDTATQQWELIPLGSHFLLKNEHYQHYVNAQEGRVNTSATGFDISRHWTVIKASDTPVPDAPELLGRSVTIESVTLTGRFLEEGETSNLRTEIAENGVLSTWEMIVVGASSQGHDIVLFRNQQTGNYARSDGGEAFGNAQIDLASRWLLTPVAGQVFNIRHIRSGRFLEGGEGNAYNVNMTSGINDAQEWRIQSAPSS